MKWLLCVICLGTVFCFGQNDWGLGLGDRVSSLAEDDNGNIYALCSESLHCVTHTGDKLWSAGIGGNYIGYLDENNFIVAGDSLCKIRQDTVVWRKPVSGVNVLPVDDGGFLVLDPDRSIIRKVSSLGELIDSSIYDEFLLTNLQHSMTGDVICAARKSATGKLFFLTMDRAGQLLDSVETEKISRDIGNNFAVLKDGKLAVYDCHYLVETYLWIFDRSYQLLTTAKNGILPVGSTSRDGWCTSISATEDGGCVAMWGGKMSINTGRYYYQEVDKISADGVTEWKESHWPQSSPDRGEVIQSGFDESYLFSFNDQLYKYAVQDSVSVTDSRVPTTGDMRLNGRLFDMNGACIGVLEDRRAGNPSLMKIKWDLKSGIYFMQRDDGPLMKILIR